MASSSSAWLILLPQVTKDSLNAPSLNFEDCISSITLGATGFFFRSEVAIVSGKTAIVILAREREKRSRQDHDRALSPTIAASLRKKPLWHPGYLNFSFITVSKSNQTGAGFNYIFFLSYLFKDLGNKMM